MSNASLQIGVRTGAKANLQPGGQGTSSATPQDADTAAVERFDQILSGAPLASSESATAQALPSPLTLLHRPNLPGEKTMGSHNEQTAKQLLAAISQSVSQLLVGEGAGGRRQVQITLDHEFLPGVSVSMYEDAGAWVADIFCSDSLSYALLSKPASDMARQLAQALKQDALWRVSLEERSDQGVGQMEAFASYP